MNSLAIKIMFIIKTLFFLIKLIKVFQIFIWKHLCWDFVGMSSIVWYGWCHEMSKNLDTGGGQRIIDWWNENMESMVKWPWSPLLMNCPYPFFVAALSHAKAWSVLVLFGWVKWKKKNEIEMKILNKSKV